MTPLSLTRVSIDGVAQSRGLAPASPLSPGRCNRLQEPSTRTYKA